MAENTNVKTASTKNGKLRTENGELISEDLKSTYTYSYYVDVHGENGTIKYAFPGEEINPGDRDFTEMTLTIAASDNNAKDAIPRNIKYGDIENIEKEPEIGE